MIHSLFRASFYYLIFFIPVITITAQTFIMQPVPGDSPRLEFSFDKPFHESDADVSTFSGVYQFSFNVPISSKFNIIATIPYINLSYEMDYGYGKYKRSENGMGNVFIGLQTRQDTADNEKSTSTLGLFIPSAEENVALTGVFYNYYDVLKYMPNSVGLYYNYAYHWIDNNGLSLGVEAGPNFYIPTEKNNLDLELYVHYGLRTGFNIDRLSLGAEFLGIAILTQDVDNFADRMVHLLNFGAQWKETPVTPKIYYRIYLKEEFQDMIDGVLGLGVSVSFD